MSNTEKLWLRIGTVRQPRLALILLSLWDMSPGVERSSREFTKHMLPVAKFTCLTRLVSQFALGADTRDEPLRRTASWVQEQEEVGLMKYGERPHSILTCGKEKIIPDALLHKLRLVQSKSDTSASWCPLAIDDMIASFLREAMTEDVVRHIQPPPKAALGRRVLWWKFVGIGYKACGECRSISSPRLVAKARIPSIRGGEGIIAYNPKVTLFE